MIMKCHYRQSGIYEISKTGPRCGLGKMNGPFVPILHQQQLCRHTFFLKFCIQGTYNNKQTNEIQNICNFQIFFFYVRIHYCTRNLFKCFKVGQNAPSLFRVQQACGIMIVFKCFFQKIQHKNLHLEIYQVFFLLVRRHP